MIRNLLHNLRCRFAKVTAPSLTGRAGGESVILFFFIFILFSCTRYELERYYDGRADVHITYDWDSLYHERPDGLTLMLAHNGDVITYTDPSNNIFENTLKLKSGTYLLTVMNNTFREFGSMDFYQRNSHDGIYAKSKTYNITDEQAWDYQRTYMEEPERIGCAVDTFDITTDIDELHFYNYRDEMSGDTVHLEQPQVILPMTTTLHISVKVRGISYMRSMEGYITGMADGFYLSQGWRRTESGSIKLTNWQRDSSRGIRTRADGDSIETNVGWMTTTFGLPHGRELLKWRTPESNYIHLHFTLINGKTVNFSYFVGRDIRYEGDDGTLDVFSRADVTLNLDLVIDAPFYDDEEVPIMPYAQPEGSGQFDATVAPWGDDVDVDIEI